MRGLVIRGYLLGHLFSLALFHEEGEKKQSTCHVSFTGNNTVFFYKLIYEDLATTIGRPEYDPKP